MNMRRIIGIILAMVFLLSTVTGCSKPKSTKVSQTGNAIYYNVGNTKENKEDVKDKVIKEEELKWWQDTIVYEAYPSSFKDTDGNGYGDLQGLISELDHIKSLGVGAIWLTPVFASPMKDNGYDVSNYYEINRKRSITARIDSTTESCFWRME